MSELENAPDLTVDDALDVLKGLAVGSKHLAKTLYQRYVDQQRAKGLEPVHASVFGRMLGRLGCQRRRIGTGAKGRSAWLVTRWVFDHHNVEAVRATVGVRSRQPAASPLT
jgi:hypothetical protein